jgi:hypothetical protein
MSLILFPFTRPGLDNACGHIGKDNKNLVPTLEMGKGRRLYEARCLCYYTKLRLMQWAGHVVRLGEAQNAYNTSVRISEQFGSSGKF